MSDRDVQNDVVRALANTRDREVPRLILAHFGRLHPRGMSAAINTLVSRRTWAVELLDAVAKEQIPRDAITAWHARQIQGFNNDKLTKRLAKVWGDIRETSEEKRARIAELKKLLASKANKQPDLSHGRRLYKKNCANCHTLFGTGGNIGPDLTGANRKNLEYLLENIVDPSASLAANFRTSLVETVTGRLITGVVSSPTKRTIAVQTPEEQFVIDRDDVGEIEPTNQSLMPDGILKPLSSDDISALFAYLQATGQVPLPDESAPE